MPLTWIVRQRRATPEQIRAIYRSAEWKAARYEVLRRQPRCRHCGVSAVGGSAHECRSSQAAVETMGLAAEPAEPAAALRIL